MEQEHSYPTSPSLSTVSRKQMALTSFKNCWNESHDRWVRLFRAPEASLSKSSVSISGISYSPTAPGCNVGHLAAFDTIVFLKTRNRISIIRRKIVRFSLIYLHHGPVSEAFVWFNGARQRTSKELSGPLLSLNEVGPCCLIVLLLFWLPVLVSICSLNKVVRDLGRQDICSDEIDKN